MTCFMLPSNSLHVRTNYTSSSDFYQKPLLVCREKQMYKSFLRPCTSTDTKCNNFKVKYRTSFQNSLIKIKHD